MISLNILSFTLPPELKTMGYHLILLSNLIGKSTLTYHELHTNNMFRQNHLLCEILVVQLGGPTFTIK